MSNKNETGGLQPRNYVKKLVNAYYSPKGFIKGIAAIKRLSQLTGVSESLVKNWLIKQAIWQIYLPRPKYIPRPTFDVIKPNSVHQAVLLFFLVIRLDKRHIYALTVVDIASRFKAAEPLTSKEGNEVAKAFEKIYKGPLKFPNLLQVDPGKEFMGSVNKLMNDKGVRKRRGNVNIHRDQGIVERFNRTLGEKLFINTVKK